MSRRRWSSGVLPKTIGDDPTPMPIDDPWELERARAAHWEDVKDIDWHICLALRDPDRGTGPKPWNWGNYRVALNQPPLRETRDYADHRRKGWPTSNPQPVWPSADPEKVRKVANLRMAIGFSPKEWEAYERVEGYGESESHVAARLGISQPAVNQRMKSARARVTAWRVARNGNLMSPRIASGAHQPLQKNLPNPVPSAGPQEESDDTQRASAPGGA